MFLPWMRRTWRPLPCCAALAAALLLVGCGKPAGPPRYEVSGRVTYNGQPVPAGFIQFVPDAAQGNRGPAGGAEIRNGRYKTTADKGAVGGPHQVEISGSDGVPFDGPEGRQEAGQPLFSPYATQVDLPQHSATLDFDVPAER